MVMRKDVSMRRLGICFIWGLMCVCANVGFGADSGRFSQSISEAERAESGISRLSTDQVAVLDALVRRDRATTARSRPDQKQPLVFSQRLSAGERKLIGIEALGPGEVARLDALVGGHADGGDPAILLGPAITTTGGSSHRIAVEQPRKEREIHGTATLTYGVGRGGFSEKSGSMVVTMLDPERNFSVSVGYGISRANVPAGMLVRRP